MLDITKSSLAAFSKAAIQDGPEAGALALLSYVQKQGIAPDDIVAVSHFIEEVDACFQPRNQHCSQQAAIDAFMSGYSENFVDLPARNMG